MYAREAVIRMGNSTYDPTSMTFGGLKEEALRALAEGGYGDGRAFEGRVIGVKTTPAKGNGSGMAVGFAALPADYRTPPHSHASEEVAVILSGRGGVDIDGVVYPVEEGTVLVTPSNSVHATFADEGGPLVVLWFYAPPGSESRWLED
jgi:quercetin dioxygenase-like cupin family protein